MFLQDGIVDNNGHVSNCSTENGFDEGQHLFFLANICLMQQRFMEDALLQSHVSIYTGQRRWSRRFYLTLHWLQTVLFSLPYHGHAIHMALTWLLTINPSLNFCSSHFWLITIVLKNFSVCQMPMRVLPCSFPLYNQMFVNLHMWCWSVPLSIQGVH